MHKQKTIELGGATFQIHPLNIGEIEELVDHIDAMAAGSARQRIAASRAILLIALRREHPQMTGDDVGNIEATIGELRAAVGAIFELSGFTQRIAENPPAGEAQAG